MQRYVVLDKAVGQTPLECMEAWRAAQPPAFADTPLTYAGRLDPLASGKLLILIGEECKNKEHYLALDKQYDFSILFGIATDTGDPLGLITTSQESNPILGDIQSACRNLEGAITLPYPAYSSKTVNGKPLHTWSIEGRLDEITIPQKTSTIYRLNCSNIRTVEKTWVYENAFKKINSIPPVTESRKALGNDFRRSDIRARWQEWHDDPQTPESFTIADCTCICSSGTYMRSLAERIAKDCGSVGLAFTISRTTIGRYQALPIVSGFWLKKY